MFNSTFRTPSKPMRKVSIKKLADDSLYWPRRMQFLIDHRNCQFPKCLSHASQVHHKRGRGKYYLDMKTWMACCLDHHAWIESHKNEARKMGLILYK